ncbi:MAG: hypothetical protein M1823_001084 [Watsoniomyces obsoletus]|nr:MAG: hypothetical protein M1823_001084 [Watsoniomyces obsoletus]
MEPPPTYTEATSRDPWTIIRGYVHESDLHAACLVSLAWNRIFTHALWAEPVFTSGHGSGIENFCNFLQCICIARPSTLHQVQVLHLPYDPEDIWTDLPSDWNFVRILLHLPSLRVIELPGTKLLDRAFPKPMYRQDLTVGLTGPPRVMPDCIDGIKLLDISHSQDVRQRSLLDLLERLPELVYLDMSGIGDSQLSVVQCSLPHLEILKLNNVNLMDIDLDRIAMRHGTKLWSLSVCGNLLTDYAAKVLVGYCFPPPEYTDSPEESDDDDESSGHALRNRWLEERERRRRKRRRGLLPLRKDDARTISELLRHNSTSERLNPSSNGLSHLYISKNQITASGIGMLLKTRQLQALDCGRPWVPKSFDSYGLECYISEDMTRTKETAKLLPELRRSVAGKLSWLRVTHRLVTIADVMDNKAGLRGIFPTPYELALQLGYLDTLILVDVPLYGSSVTAGLLSFLTSCAHHESTNQTETHAIFSPPPNTSRRASAAAESSSTYYDTHEDLPDNVSDATRSSRRHRPPPPPPPQALPTSPIEPPRTIYLRTIQLEMARRNRGSDGVNQPSRSITEDLDSDTFHLASQGDFSFFPDETKPRQYTEDYPTDQWGQSQRYLPWPVLDLNTPPQPNPLSTGGSTGYIRPIEPCEQTEIKYEEKTNEQARLPATLRGTGIDPKKNNNTARSSNSTSACFTGWDPKVSSADVLGQLISFRNKGRLAKERIEKMEGKRAERAPMAAGGAGGVSDEGGALKNEQHHDDDGGDKKGKGKRKENKVRFSDADEDEEDEDENYDMKTKWPYWSGRLRIVIPKQE